MQGAMTRKKIRLWRDYRLRVCRFMNYCKVCDKTITMGQEYFDGQYGRRAHKDCGEMADDATESGAYL